LVSSIDHEGHIGCHTILGESAYFAPELGNAFQRLGGGDETAFKSYLDGKPNDVDRYDGRYGIEDTKKTIEEVKKWGLHLLSSRLILMQKNYQNLIEKSIP